MTKHYKYCITLHNLRPGKKSIVQAALRKLPHLKKELCAEEEYCDKEGNPLPDRPDRHIHIFIEFRNQRHYHSMLKTCERIAKPLIYPDQLHEGTWGRVHIDIGRGEIEQMLDYLEGATKLKPLDADVLEIHETIPPGHYTCYICNNHNHALDFYYTHENQTGVCYRCYHIFSEIPGQFQYCQISRRMHFFHDLKKNIAL